MNLCSTFDIEDIWCHFRMLQQKAIQSLQVAKIAFVFLATKTHRYMCRIRKGKLPQKDSKIKFTFDAGKWWMVNGDGVFCFGN